MRIYIVGGPGSGKTSLARALSRRLGLPLLEFDTHWDRLFERDADGRPTDAAFRFRTDLIATYVSQDRWVIEGAEPAFLEALADVSDLIVWCDISFRMAATRMLRRHVLADLGRRNAYPGYRRLFRFLASVRRRYAAPPEASADAWAKWTRARVEHAVRRHEAKVLRVTSGSLSDNVRSVESWLGDHAKLRED